MRHATEPRGRKYVEGYGFLSFARNLASSAGAREAARRARATLVKQGKEAAVKAGKRDLSKTAEATGDLVGQKIADKITWKTKTTKQQDRPVALAQSVVQSVTQSREFSPEQRQKILREDQSCMSPWLLWLPETTGSCPSN